MDKVIFDKWMNDIKSWNTPLVHIVIVEEDNILKMYKNEILMLEKIKEKQ